MDIPTFCSNCGDPLCAGPLLRHPQIWEQPVSLSDEGMANGIFVMQDYGLDIDLPQSQLAHSPLHLPRIDWGAYQESPLPYNNQALIPVSAISPIYPQLSYRSQGAFKLTTRFQLSCSARPLPEISQGGGSIPTEVVPGLDNSHDAPFNAPFRTTRLPDTSRVVPCQLHLPLDTSVPEGRSYDRPGRKPAAPFQHDPLVLEETCRQAGGSTFAIDWVISTFKYGVTTEALHRVLECKEIDEMEFPGGFEPYQAYDGFISKVGGRYECVLCKEGNRVRWKHKKDAPWHLRKFHFGLADECKAW